jgi:hypothetical protein
MLTNLYTYLKLEKGRLSAASRDRSTSVSSSGKADAPLDIFLREFFRTGGV